MLKCNTKKKCHVFFLFLYDYIFVLFAYFSK